MRVLNHLNSKRLLEVSLLRAAKTAVDIDLYGVGTLCEYRAIVKDAHGYRLILIVHLTHSRSTKLKRMTSDEVNR